MKTLQLSEENARKIYGITASDEIKQILEDSFPKGLFTPHPNLNEPVLVAGIMWGGYLTPSENCDAPVKFNEETGLHYFDQLTSAPLHAFEQGLRLATKEHYQQLYDHTTQRDETIDCIKYKVFTDKETGNELWMVYSGFYDFEDQEFNDVGDFGYYWSASVYIASYGYLLHFTSGSVYPQSSRNRRYGFHVRCVVQ